MEEYIWLILISELVFLFFTSRYISKALFSLSYKVFRKQSIAIRFVALIFFPGTVIHELAHYLMAKMLFVRTGKVELTPELHGNGLKLGSVQVAKSDILRQFLIGVAPLLFGSALLVLGTYYSLPKIINFSLDTSYLILATLYLYVIFVITNTMFSSKKDMEGALGLFIFIAFVTSVIFVAGREEWLIEPVRFINGNLMVQLYSKQAAQLLLIPVGINFTILLLNNLVRFLRKNN